MVKKKKGKSRKQDDLLDLASTAIKAGVVLGVANTVINATKN